jgi:hypothetical protein
MCGSRHRRHHLGSLACFFVGEGGVAKHVKYTPTLSGTFACHPRPLPPRGGTRRRRGRAAALAHPIGGSASSPGIKHGSGKGVRVPSTTDGGAANRRVAVVTVRLHLSIWLERRKLFLTRREEN